MPRFRVEISSVRGKMARRFGVLLVKSLFQKAGIKQLSILHVSLAAKARAPALFHRKTHEFFFVLQGSVRGRINGKPCRFRRGDCCFLPAGAVHEFQAGKSGAQTLDVFFPGLDLGDPDIVSPRAR